MSLVQEHERTLAPVKCFEWDDAGLEPDLDTILVPLLFTKTTRTDMGVSD